jgi:hypothetical protein
MTRTCWRLFALIVLAAPAVGCGNSGSAEIPKNPVPRAKPDVASPVGAGGKTGAVAPQAPTPIR